jgi:predicted HicB family RNase H-like nuclease
VEPGEAMKNTMNIEGNKAMLTFDPEINLFRGEFIGLNGGADFYAATVEKLHKEGKISLKVFLDGCREKGIEPRRNFSGRFNVRLEPDVHEAAVMAAAAEDMSLNEWVAEKIAEAARAA